MDFEKVSKQEKCKNGCIFCEMRCPKCGSVKIRVQYEMYYTIDGVHSFAYVDCDCGKTVLEKIPIPKGICDPQYGDQFFTRSKQKVYEHPELAKYIDELFEDYHPVDDDETYIMYSIENDTEDCITLDFEDRDFDVDFNKPLPNEICLEGSTNEKGVFDIKGIFHTRTAILVEKKLLKQTE